MFAPTRMPISRSPTGTPMAGLAITAALASMVRTIRILEIRGVTRLRRCILIVSEICRIRWRLTRTTGYVPHAGFFLPSVCLIGVRVDVGDDGGSSAEGRVRAICGVAFAGIREGFIGVIVIRFQGVGDLRMLSGGAANVAVAFENFFSRDVGGVVEER